MADPQTPPPQLSGVPDSPVTADPATAAAAAAKEAEEAKDKRERFERLDILSRSLLPIAIAVATGVFSYVQWHTDQNRLAASRLSDSTAAVSQQRLAVSQLVNSFVPSLTSEKSTNRILALQAIAYVDTALGNALATALTTDTSAAVRVAAANVQLSATHPFLSEVEQVFGPTGASRIAGTRALLANPAWMADTAMVTALLDAARRDSANANGLFNTITILRTVPAEVQRVKKNDILAFTQRIPATLPTVRARADTLARIVASR